MKTFTKTLLVMFAVGGALNVIGDYHQKYGHSDPQQTQAKVAEELPKYLTQGFVFAEVLREDSKNPSSFELIELSLHAETVCITYKGTNGFGATIREHAVLHNNVPLAEGGPDDAKFRRNWNKYCQDAGRDWTYTAQHHMRMLALSSNFNE